MPKPPFIVDRYIFIGQLRLIGAYGKPLKDPNDNHSPSRHH